MKNCPKCRDRLAPNVEMCSCGHWFRANPAATGGASAPATAPFEGSKLKATRRREWLITGGLLTAGLVVGLGLSGLLPHTTPPATPLSPAMKAEMTSPETLASVAELFNQGLPRKVSRDVQLDRVNAEPDRLAMYYTLIGQTAESAPAAEVEKAFRGKLEASYCDDDASKMIRAAGISVAHRYADSNGRLITEILVTPSSCGTRHTSGSVKV